MAIMKTCKQFADELDALMKKHLDSKSESWSMEAYTDLWKKAVSHGLRVSRKWVGGELKHRVVQKTHGTSVPWKQLNLSPDGKDHCDCTTRALAYCLPRLSYAELRKMQEEAASEFWTKWNCAAAWGEVLAREGGYAEVKLSKKIARFKVAKALSSLSYPVVAHSSRHVAVVDRGTVVDSWDSRNGRVDRIWVKRGDEVSAKRMLA